MDRYEAVWQEKIAALRAHVAAHGVPPLQRDAAGLGIWVSNQRQAKKAMDAGRAGKLGRGMTPARATALEAVPGWAWEVDAEAAWAERLCARTRPSTGRCRRGATPRASASGSKTSGRARRRRTRAGRVATG